MSRRSTELFASAQMQKITLPELLESAQTYMSHDYSSLVGEKSSPQKQEKMLSYLRKYLADHQFTVDGMDPDSLALRLYEEMAEYSFLTPYLNGSNTDWEEININRYDDTKIHFCDGTVSRSPEQFFSPKHAEDVIGRLLRQSGIVLDKGKPLVRGHLSKKIRITVEGYPVIDEDAGISVSIRYVNPKKLSKADFVKNGTATEEMLDTISTLYRYGCSMCLAGATGTGKTTLMEWILSTLPHSKRIYTVEETTREFDLVVRDPESGHVLNNVIHTVTKESDEPSKRVTEQMLLEQGLTFDPDYICMAEMKGDEAFETVEAAQTGHAVISTIHAKSCRGIYSRMLNLCSIKGYLSGDLMMRSIVDAFPITFFIRLGEDNVRRISEICECELTKDGKQVMHTLYRFNTVRNIKHNGKTVVDGYFKRVGGISDHLQQQLRDNGMPEDVLEKLIGGELAA